MKLQHLAVIFIIIILPIVIVVSAYTGNLISVVNAQSSYDSTLLNATYDAVRAYQMNTLQNAFESETNSKIRDINASVNTFFDSLALGLSSSSLSKTELTDYIPAILYTLYDGYYVYGAYDNVASTIGGKIAYSTNGEVNKTQYGLKPYVYYSCEYEKTGDYDLIVNYTLDNYITVTGSYDGNSKYIAKSGYYVNYNNIAVNTSPDTNLDGTPKPADFDGKLVTLYPGKSNSVIIKPEKLGEYLTVIDEKADAEGTHHYALISKAGEPEGTPKYYNYITYNGVKYYLDNENIGQSKQVDEVTGINTSFNYTYDNIPIFFLDRDTRIYISNSTFSELKSFLGIEDDSRMLNADDGFKDVNAYYYYYNAVNFSKSAEQALKSIDLGITTNSEGEEVIASNVPYKPDGTLDAKNVIKTETYHINYTNELGVETHVKTTYPKRKVFELDEDNNPELDSSSFNLHRMDVIISSIESSLVSTIANFNNYTGGDYVYTMPVLNENEWDRICNNISVLSFLQGLTIGNYKYYNKYALVTNTKVKDFISKESIYVQTEGGEDYSNADNMEYHNPRCIDYSAYINDNPASVIGHFNINYERQECIWIREEEGNKLYYYYLQKEERAYSCIVGQNGNRYTTDELMEGGKEIEGTRLNDEVRRAYITALARERGGSYKTYGFLNEELQLATSSVPSVPSPRPTPEPSPTPTVEPSPSPTPSLPVIPDRSAIKIGDIINYTPDTEMMSYNLPSNLSGYSSDQTIYHEEYTTWKVINIKNNGIVEAMGIPTSSMQKVYLKGATGYNNGAYLLNDICNKLYSNEELDVKARSINLDDIESKMNGAGRQARNTYTSSDGFQYGSLYRIDVDNPNTWYPKLAEHEKNISINSDLERTDGIEKSDDGTGIGIEMPLWELDTTDYINSKNKGNSITVKQIFYNVEQEEHYYDEPKFYDIIFNTGTEYYLASRCYAYFTGGRNVFSFGFSRVTNKTIIGWGIFHSNGDAYTMGESLAPVVSLKEDIQFVLNATDGDTNIWDISK